MNNIKYIWGKNIEPYMHYARVKVYYTKNGIDQNAVYMNYATDGRDYKMIEDNHAPYNKLKDDEKTKIGDMLNNNEIIIKGDL